MPTFQYFPLENLISVVQRGCFMRQSRHNPSTKARIVSVGLSFLLGMSVI